MVIISAPMVSIEVAARTVDAREASRGAGCLLRWWVICYKGADDKGSLWATIVRAAMRASRFRVERFEFQGLGVEGLKAA